MSDVRVLYVGGWGRSGSTLLDRMLGRIPGFFSLGEMRDIWQRGCIENRTCGCGEPFRSCAFWSRVGEEAFGGWGEIDAAELTRLRLSVDRPWTVPLLVWRRPSAFDREVDRYVAHLSRLYSAIVKVSGARVLVDSSKICSYALVLRRMPSTDLRLLHLVRDSRGVVFSWQKNVARPDRTDDAGFMERYDIVSASGRYLLYNGLAHLVRSLGVPYLMMRYEDLVADPHRKLRQATRFAGAEPDDDALSFLQDGGASFATNHTVDGNPMRFSREVVIRKDEEWRHSMSEPSRALVSAITSPLLVRYGYPVRP